MQGLARYIEKHADKPLSLKTLAEQAQLSPAYLQRVFKRVLGVSPKAYHDAARLRLLKDALKSGKTVLESITEAGFQSTSRVYGHATRTLGMTPSTSELYGSRERHRRTKVRTGGSVGVRSQSDCGTGAMSSCAAGRRRPWRLPLGSRTQARTYRPGTRPADVMNPPTSTFPAEVLEGVEAHGIQEALDRSGFYLSPAALAPDACAELAGLYETSETLFRATIPMARYGFGRGEYKYFARPLPPAVKPSRNLTTTGGVAIKKGGRAQKRALLNSPMRTGGRLDCLQLRC
jgi:AraC-like DNA-binding protein